MAATKPRAALYVRISQDRDGSSTATDRQEKDLRALAKREGWSVADVFIDRDASAYSAGPRPGFDRMLASLDRFDVLVVWKLDRLVRRFTGFSDVLKATDAAGVRLVSIIDALDTRTAMGKGTAGLIAAMGEQESANIGTRVARKDEESAAAGRPHGHRRAFGYSPTMEIIPAEARAIRDARDRVLRGESMRSICTRWNEKGVSPTTAPAWRVSTFKRMICGAHLAGLRVLRGKVAGPGTWRPIISPEDHEHVVATLGDPKVRTRGRPASYLLTGIVRCGRCGAVLRSTVRDGKRSLACRRTAGDESHCGGLRVPAEPVEAIVAEAVLAAIDGPGIARAMRRPKSKKAAGPSISDLEDRLVQLGIDHDEGVIDRKEWLARRTPIVAKIDTARTELAAETNTSPLVPFASGDVRKRWDALDLDGQRAVIAALVESIVISKAENGSHSDPADRVSVTWRG